jgi:hypothetical protein
MQRRQEKLFLGLFDPETQSLPEMFNTGAQLQAVPLRNLQATTAEPLADVRISHAQLQIPDLKCQ